MTEAERRQAEHEALIRELVENDPLFSIFVVVDVDLGDGRRSAVLVKSEDGSGIQMPEPGSA